MGDGESEHEMVLRHVREGEKHLTDQRARIAQLKEARLPSEDSEALLAVFEDMQRLHKAHLARLESK